MPRRWLRKKRRLLLLPVLPLLAWLLWWCTIWFWPYPTGLDQQLPAATFLEDRHGQPLAAFVADDGQWRVPLRMDQISPHLLAAIMAVEDSRFNQHGGVDFHAIGAAAWDDLRHLRRRRGGSTLTMQLQRLRDPRPHTLLNKLEQAIRAEQLERRLTKQQILLEYLNRAPFGGNLVGVGAASWRYFGRPCLDLSLGESALLAGLLQSPSRLRPDRHPQAATVRRRHVLDRMLVCGMISVQQRDQAASEPIHATWHALPQKEAAGALPTLANLQRHGAGQTIRTTLDLAVQRQVYEAASSWLKALDPSGVNALAVVVLDTSNSQVLAAVSLGRQAKQVDLTQAARSTGSVLKPMIYAAAFDAGICTPQTLLDDSPAAWPGYMPGNFDGAFHGKMSAADALAESRNIPALVLLQQVGVAKTIGVLDGFGVHTIGRARKPPGLSLAIGGSEASPMEIAEAYATLGRGGVWKPISFFGSEERSARIMRAEPCWQVIAALSDETRTAALSPQAATRKVAWKTGTSSGHRDAWCAAVTPSRTVIVWLGNSDGGGSSSLIGVDAAAPLALRMIANLDASTTAWPTAPHEPLAPSHQRWLETSSRLVIASPQRNQHVVLLPDLSADRQQLQLEAQGSAGELWWFVDDVPAGQGAKRWWSPTPGTHRLRVIDAEGHSASTQITVASPAAFRAD
jgi:penicillin-binding protein 1C